METFDIPIGAHLVTQEKLGDYNSRHGVYVGKGNVIYYKYDYHKFQTCANESSLIRFCFPSGLLRVVYYSKPKFKPQKIVSRAKSKLGKKRLLRFYDPFEDTEHFATWCIYDRKLHCGSQDPWLSLNEEEDVIQSVEDIPLGTHLVSDCGIYEHHGIYAGNGRVIHHPGWRTHIRFYSKMPIEETSIKKFHEGNILKAVYYRSPKFNPQKVIERAQSQMKKDNYSLIFNNCEHFATWCIYDEKISTQVIKVGKENVRKIVKGGFQTTIISISGAAILGAGAIVAAASNLIPGGNIIAREALKATWKQGILPSEPARNVENTINKTDSLLSKSFVEDTLKPDAYIKFEKILPNKVKELLHIRALEKAKELREIRTANYDYIYKIQLDDIVKIRN